MKYLFLLTLLIPAFLIHSCTETLLGPDPENTPVNNFRLLWEDYDAHYARFGLKNVNWDSLRDVYHPRVMAAGSGEPLFDTLSALLAHLKDGHAWLESSHGISAYRRAVYPRYFDLDLITSNYLDDTRRNGVLTHGLLAGRLGYLHISSFSAPTDSYRRIDHILKAFKDVRGLIIDVRDNGGGDSYNARIIAGRFTAAKRVYGYVRYRNGSRHTDFTGYIPSYLYPEGDGVFDKPVALLTNRHSGSAAEDFILMMRQLPRVTVLGDTSAGSLGGRPKTRELPNGWIYRIPMALNYGADFRLYEGVGIPPDSTVHVSRADSLNGIDTILEAAMRLVKN